MSRTRYFVANLGGHTLEMFEEFAMAHGVDPSLIPKLTTVLHDADRDTYTFEQYRTNADRRKFFREVTITGERIPIIDHVVVQSNSKWPFRENEVWSERETS